MSTIHEKANTLLRKTARTDLKILPEHNLVEDLRMNSLRMMELISSIEDEYDVIIPVNKVVSIRTVKDVYYALEHLDEYSA